MRYFFSILLSVVFYLGYSQGSGIPDFRLRFEGNGADVSGNDFAGHFADDSTFSPTYKIEGSFSWAGGDNDSWESKGNYTFGDRKFSFACNFRIYSLYGGSRGLLSNKEGDGSQGIDIQIDETNMRIYGRSSGPGGTSDFYTADDILEYDRWYHLVAVVDSPYARIYLDGVKLTLADSGALRNDWLRGPDTLAVGGFTGAVQTRELFNGYMDNVHFYDYITSDAQAIDSLYPNRASATFQLGMLGGGTAYNPPQLRIYKDGPEKKPTSFESPDIIVKYFKKGIPGESPPPEDTIEYLFAENFESLSDMTSATILANWKPLTSFYYEASQSIVDIDGDYNKVWSSTYHSGREAQADGYELFIPFSDTTNEIWFESAEWADAAFNGYSTLCYYSGKIMNGVYGGRTPLYNYPYAVDSTAYGNGWGVDGEWGSASGGCYGGNPNAIWPYYGDAEGYYKTLQPFGYNIPRNTWVVWTRRIKINDRGQANGILEWYVNGTLIKQRTDVIWRSIAATDAKQNNVDGILYRFTFGGGSGPYYISPRDNVTRHDNLIAYKYNPSAENYLSGAAPPGHTIPIVALPVDGLANVYPDNTFSDESFTATGGTIQSHYSGVFHVPQSTTTYTKTITGHSNPIFLNFTYWHDGWNNPGENCWVKIWSGIGPSKTLLWTFEENAPVIGYNYVITNTAATIEYYPGRDFSAGWKLNYY